MEAMILRIDTSKIASGKGKCGDSECECGLGAYYVFPAAASVGNGEILTRKVVGASRLNRWVNHCSGHFTPNSKCQRCQTA